MQAFFANLIELLALSTALSSLANGLYALGTIPTTHNALLAVLLLAFIFFIIFNISRLRRCYAALHDPKAYLCLNYAVYAAFILISLFIYFVCGETVYAWMFNIFKVIRFSKLGWSALASSALFHGIMLAVIALTQIGMDWIYKYDT